MELNKAIAALLLEKMAETGLQVKPFKEHPERGVSASAQCALSDGVELTVDGVAATYFPRINVNVNFFKAREPKAAAVNTLTTASLKRVGDLVGRFRGEKQTITADEVGKLEL